MPVQDVEERGNPEVERLAKHLREERGMKPADAVKTAKHWLEEAAKRAEHVDEVRAARVAADRRAIADQHGGLSARRGRLRSSCRRCVRLRSVTPEALVDPTVAAELRVIERDIADAETAIRLLPAAKAELKRRAQAA